MKVILDLKKCSNCIHYNIIDKEKNDYHKEGGTCILDNSKKDDHSDCEKFEIIKMILDDLSFYDKNQGDNKSIS
jgi:hypothetical protein